MLIAERVSAYAASPVQYNECVTDCELTISDDRSMLRIYHALLALIASATDRELEKYVESHSAPAAMKCKS